MTPEVQQVLSTVARRQALRAFGRATFRWTCGLGVVYLVAMLAARLLTFGPDWYDSWTVLCVPVAGALAGWVTYRRSSLQSAARAADQGTGTEDLFLTSLDADQAPGAYRPLVHASAAAAAKRIPVAEVAPLPLGGPAAKILIALGVLWTAALFLPPLDPFARREDALLLGQQREQLVAEKKATARRKEALKAKKLDQANSKEIDDALKQVMSTFRKMRGKDKRGNEKRLKETQKALGSKWREAQARTQSQGSPASRLQSMGQSFDRKKMEEWRKDLEAGSAKSLRREIADLRDSLKEMEAAETEAEREAIRKKMQEKAKNLAEFLKNNASSKPLDEALAKALNQMQALKSPGLAKEAQKALEQTLDLSEMEMKNLAQAMRDMKSLEQALKTLQKARAANAKGGKKRRRGAEKGKGQKGQGEKGEKGQGEKGQGEKGEKGQGEKGQGEKGEKGQGEKGQGEKGEGGENEDDFGLDGNEMPDMESLKEYEEYYERLLAEQGGMEPGPGMGEGSGPGEGGIAPENTDQKNGFKTEKSRSALRAGRLLMSMKTKEVGDKGRVEEDYARSVEAVKQGVSEAILQERVPPRHHEGIRKYFDSLSEDAKKKAGTQPKKDGK